MLILLALAGIAAPAYLVTEMFSQGKRGLPFALRWALTGLLTLFFGMVTLVTALDLGETLGWILHLMGKAGPIGLILVISILFYLAGFAVLCLDGLFRNVREILSERREARLQGRPAPIENESSFDPITDLTVQPLEAADEDSLNTQGGLS